MTQEPQFKTLAADGRTMYPFPDRIADFVDWVTPVTELRGFGGYGSSRILVAPSDVTTLEYRVTAGRPAVLRYTRDRENAAFPAELTVEDWPAFRNSLGYDDDDEYLADRMYTAQRAPQEYETCTVDLTGYTDLPANLLDPASVEDADSTLTWQVAAPYLVFGEVYAAAMPGALIEVRERIAKDVQTALPNINVYTSSARTDGAVKGSVTLTYEDRRTHPIKVGRRTENRVDTKLFTFSFPIPKNIVGSSKADAVAKFQAVVDEIVGQITSKKAVVCGHCNGEGVIVA